MLSTLNSSVETTTLIDIEEQLSEIIKYAMEADDANEYFSGPLKFLKEFALTYGGKLVVAIVLIIIGFKIINVVNTKLMKSKLIDRFDINAGKLFVKLATILMKVFLVITALAILGVPMSSIITIIGSCGLAIGLALQGALANIAGGIVLMILKPFKVGDLIAVNDTSAKVEGSGNYRYMANDFMGVVQEIGIFNTRIITESNNVIVVPNATISNSTLTNFSVNNKRKVEMILFVNEEEEVRKVEGVLNGACYGTGKILSYPEPKIHLSAFRDGAVEYTVTVWCETRDYDDVYFGLLKKIKTSFEENNIKFAAKKIAVQNT